VVHRVADHVDDRGAAAAGVAGERLDESALVEVDREGELRQQTGVDGQALSARGVCDGVRSDHDVDHGARVAPEGSGLHDVAARQGDGELCLGEPVTDAELYV
jgi:hypothetical protein